MKNGFEKNEELFYWKIVKKENVCKVYLEVIRNLKVILILDLYERRNEFNWMKKW